MKIFKLRAFAGVRVRDNLTTMIKWNWDYDTMIIQDINGQFTGTENGFLPTLRDLLEYSDGLMEYAIRKNKSGVLI